VDTALLETGREFLSRLGYRVKHGACLGLRTGYLAGSDGERRAEINEFLMDPEVKAVFFARGGYGAMRVLPGIEWRRMTPTLLVGMSDITALQLALYTMRGEASLSAPMPAGLIAHGLDPLSAKALEDALTRHWSEIEFFPRDYPVRTLRDGAASGPLLGGCLSLITALQGSPYFPDMRGVILFAEDVHEPLYKIDRMWMQLKLSGALDSISALILGTFTDPEGRDISPAVDDVVCSLLDAAVPVIGGCRMLLDTTHGSLRLTDFDNLS
jgi:muramoyltetrapeptide carboxypeptidase